MSERKVDLRILFGLLKNRGRLGIMGLVFTILSIFVFIPLIVILSVTLKKPYERYDFDKIRSFGIEKIANVTGVRTVANVTMNEQHPVVISYEYQDDGRTVSDHFETLDKDKIKDIAVGSKINILVYENQSTIKSLVPFSFPVGAFYILPAMFFIIGTAFLLIGFIPALGKFNLYKHGIVKDAYIVSVSAETGFGFPLNRRQNMIVNYYYTDAHGNKIFGDSTTDDLLMLNGKKTGDEIKILVSEADERKSCLIPHLEALKYNWAI